MWDIRKTVAATLGIAAAAASVPLLVSFFNTGPPVPDVLRGGPHGEGRPTRRATEERLEGCLGLTAGEVVRKLGLGGGKWFWCDEPPGVLRGVVYYPPGDAVGATLYIDSRETLYRQPSLEREWDYEAFLRCRVGGIQYRAGDEVFDIGADVPWQWRR